MIDALRSPQTRLDERQEIAKRIQEVARVGDWEDLRDDPRPIYVWDKMFYSPYTNGYCIYCNTTVAVWDRGSLRGFRHNHH